MKITIYTVNDCVFSKQEKDYLTAKGIQFEEKNLETNRAWLDEMLSVSNNFAGTPVTKIDKDNGQSVVLKGFTEAEFTKELEQAPAAGMHADGAVTSDMPATPPPVEPPANPEPITPVEPTPTVHEMPQQPETPVSTMSDQPTPPPVEPPANPEPPTMPEPPMTPSVEEPKVETPTNMASMAPEPPASTPMPPMAPTEPPMAEPTPPTPPATEPTMPPATQTTNPALSSILNQLENRTDTTNQSSTMPQQAFN